MNRTDTPADKNLEIGDENITPDEIESIEQSDLELYQIMASGLDLNFADVIFALTHKEMEEGEAQALWAAIKTHNDKMTAALGRDPGVLVSALDYLYNITGQLRQPTVIEQKKIEELAENS